MKRNRWVPIEIWTEGLVINSQKEFYEYKKEFEAFKRYYCKECGNDWNGFNGHKKIWKVFWNHGECYKCKKCKKRACFLHFNRPTKHCKLCTMDPEYLKTSREGRVLTALTFVLCWQYARSANLPLGTVVKDVKNLIVEKYLLSK